MNSAWIGFSLLLSKKTRVVVQISKALQVDSSGSSHPLALKNISPNSQCTGQWTEQVEYGLAQEDMDQNKQEQGSRS